MKKMINVKDLKVADVRYFDTARNGLEFVAPVSRVVLLNRGDTYINLLNPGEIAPIYRRIPNTTNPYSTEDYFGTKIEHVCGEEKTGEAWLLADVDFKSIFHGDVVTIEDVEDYVLRSSSYFHNRAEVIERRLQSHRSKLSNRDIVLLIDTKVKDGHSKEAMDKFFAERGVQKVYTK
jgi:hypothetical protein